MRNIIAYFSQRHLLTNVMFFGLIFLSIFVWRSIGKEEMPEFASNWVRINTTYPGAPAEDVELFVTRPLEDELKGVVGIEEVTTTSSVGSSSIRVVIDDSYPDKDEVVREIKDAALRADLPSEVRDLPRIRQFKSSEKAILDIGLYHKSHKFLDTKARQELQKYVLSFENQLLAINEVSSISKDHYRKPELQILVDTKKKKQQQISLTEIKNQIQKNHVRVPIGSMDDKQESKVTALNELESVDTLNELVVRGNYQGEGVKLKELANIHEGFEKTQSIFKINGHEGVFLNIRKSVSTDILTAKEAISKFINRYKKSNADSPVGIVLMDDESYEVVNRINIISSNGILGFILIIIVLLIFLDAKSGFWVAMGIPFSMAFTLIIASIVGYTINNMTLAGIIIVLGIVVDDAIIIAENISRHRESGLSMKEAAIIGAREVCLPILASIITTCIAFVPLMYFEGFFGKLVSYIPLVVALMLIGSLIESLFILPAHISGKTYFLDKFEKSEGHVSWFKKYENKYKNILLSIFKHRYIVLVLSLSILVGAIALFKTKMKFVMFPREESKEVFIKVKAREDATRFETAKIIAPLEELFVKDTDNVVGVRSTIALSRWGGEVRENEGSILVELKPADERDVNLDQLLEKWEPFAKKLEGLESAKFRRGRWGWDSGIAIEVQVQENNDNTREKVVAEIEQEMKKISYLVDVEIQKPLVKNEFIFKLIQEKLMRYNVSATNITTALRSFVEGSILYSINKGEEEIDVRLTVPEVSKESFDELMDLRIENNSGHLIFLKNVVDVEEVKRPVNIQRANFKRMTMIYANIKEGEKVSPLEAADYLEENIFPNIMNKYPTSVIVFKGEIEDSRESQGEFKTSIIVVIALIYLILVVMFNSLLRPLIVLSVIPFGFAGVIYVLMLHGMSVYGFFAVIGALGMIGVVVNDSIVMIDKIETEKSNWERIAEVASTRLRPVLVTTITTVVGILPTAYGLAGYDSMLAEMMLTMGWGLAFGTIITLIIIPSIYATFTKNE